MSRKLTRFMDDPVVAAISKEITELQAEITRLRQKRNSMVGALVNRGQYQNNDKYRKRQKEYSRQYYYKVVRPTMYPHLPRRT